MINNSILAALFFTVSCHGFFNSMLMKSSKDLTPNVFDFTDVNAAAVSTVFEDSFLPVGYDTTTVVSITNGSGTLRKNSTGGWANTVQIDPGDTLNIRMTSSSTEARALSTQISVGTLNIDWQVTTDFSCGGNPKVNGSCWYLSTASQNCETTCASYNGYNTLTESYVGANANDCGSVLDALSVGSGVPADQNWISLQCGFSAVGCMIKSGTRYRCTAVNRTAKTSNVQRVCGCNGLGAIDTTPLAFDFVDGVNVAAGTLYQTSQVISGINTSITAIATVGKIRKNGSGSWSSSVSISDGDTLNLRMTSSQTDSATVQATVTIGTESADWDLTTTHATSCNPGMTLLNGACWQMSNQGDSCASTCSGPGYDVQTLTYAGSSGSNANCDTVLSALGIAGTATVTDGSCGGGYGCYFESGTRKRCSLATTDTASTSAVSRACACTGEDITPAPFDFTDVIDAGIGGAYQTSTTINGFDGLRTLYVTGSDAQVRKNGSGGWGSSIGLNSGDTLNLRMTSSNSMGQTDTATLSVGAVQANWTITTLSPCLAGGGETAGSCWYYGAMIQSCDAVCSTKGGYDSATATYAGINTVNCQQAFDAAGGPLGVTAGSVLDNLSCFVNNIGCHFAVTVRNLCNAGGVSSSAAMLTFARICACGSPDDITPNAFDFTDVTTATQSTIYEDNTTISGIDVSIPAAVISGGLEIRKNSTGSWLASISLSAGDTLNVRVTSSAAAATAVQTSLSVGSAIIDWDVTTL